MIPSYSQDIARIFAAEIGDGGLTSAAFDLACNEAWQALQRLRDEHHAGGPLMRHVFSDDDIPSIEAAASGLSELASRIFLIGTGGSSLGAKTLSAAAPAKSDHLAKGTLNSAICSVLENADPHAISISPDDEFGDMAFIVISKSGTTAETLAIFFRCWDLASNALGDQAAARFLVITGAHESPLRRIAEQNGMKLMDHEPDVAGRMSILTNVGLLPATIESVDGRSVRAGARAVAETVLAAGSVTDCPPAVGAAMQVALMRKRGATASIMMPYSNHLKDFSRWYCQLWAESLGKSGMGSLPYPALGMVDQHSQLQFWLSGPPMGVYTLIDLLAAPTPTIRTADPDLRWMEGKTLGQMMKAASRATGETLARHGRPVRILHLKSSSIDARTVGALAMHFLAETVLAGYMLGVDPYTQPAVDTGKALMREYLSNLAAD